MKILNDKSKQANMPTEVVMKNYEKVPMANPSGYKGTQEGMMEQMRKDVAGFKKNFDPRKS